MSARVAAAAFGAMLLMGCAAGQAADDPIVQGEVYARPLDDARRIVLATELPFPLQGTAMTAIWTRSQPDGTIALGLLDARGDEHLRYTATLVPAAADRTRVTVTYAGTGADNSVVTANGAKHPELVALFLKVVREQIDAQLEGRPYDNLAIGPELMVAIGANAASIGADMRADIEAASRSDRANIDDAYAAEARGAR